jgi:hypothetical protein
MNTLEDRVRAAARAAAGTVADGSAPPLKLPPPGRRPGLRGWGGRHPWIVSLAAAAAVIALIVASIFAARAVVPGARRPAAGPPTAPLPHLADGLPAYFLEYSMQDQISGGEPRTANSPPIPSRLRSHETLQVVATATGKVAATATLPGYVTAIAASRGAFFAAVVRDNKARFYEIRLNDGRTATTVTELPIRPDTAPLAFMAVSPDGTKLAYSTFVVHGVSGQVQNLVVASTTDGSQREWRTPAQDSQGSISSMTWLTDGRMLAFNWIDWADTPPARSLRLLDTAAPGSNLMQAPAVLPSVYEARPFEDDSALSPNGQVVVGSASGSAASRAPEDSLVAFSAATGQETVLYRASINGPHGHGCYSPPLWISHAGSAVLVTCFQAHEVKTVPHLHYAVNVVLFNHGHATLLPWLNATAEGVTAFPPVSATGRPANNGT